MFVPRLNEAINKLFIQSEYFGEVKWSTYRLEGERPSPQLLSVVATLGTLWCLPLSAVYPSRIHHHIYTTASRSLQLIFNMTGHVNCLSPFTSFSLPLSIVFSTIIYIKTKFTKPLPCLPAISKVGIWQWSPRQQKTNRNVSYSAFLLNSEMKFEYFWV